MRDQRSSLHVSRASSANATCGLCGGTGDRNKSTFEKLMSFGNFPRSGDIRLDKRLLCARLEPNYCYGSTVCRMGGDVALSVSQLRRVMRLYF